MPTARLRKLIVEFRYPAKLGFYHAMDRVGEEFSTEYPDWERSPLSLQVHNKKKHRRLFLSVKRSFFESDTETSTPDKEYELASKHLHALTGMLALEELKRVGVRQWFCIDLEKSFAHTVDIVKERFMPASAQLSQILNDVPADVAYVVDYKTSDDWKYNFRLGPMTKDEWFDRVNYDRKVFAGEEEDADATFEKFKDTLPNSFVFVDVDCYKEDVRTDVVDQLIVTFRRRTQAILGQISKYCGD